jgi:predicted RNase H-like nuclease (RuvC/YqgF family)
MRFQPAEGVCVCVANTVGENPPELVGIGAIFGAVLYTPVDAIYIPTIKVIA